MSLVSFGVSHSRARSLSNGFLIAKRTKGQMGVHSQVTAGSRFKAAARSGTGGFHNALAQLRFSLDPHEIEDEAAAVEEIARHCTTPPTAIVSPFANFTEISHSPNNSMRSSLKGL